MTGRFRQALSEKKTPLWQRKEGKNPDGGLNVAGSKSAGVGRPVTKKPSKLKKGSKAANRRKSFCSRMGGMKKKLTSKKTASDPDSRINKALRKWNCSTDVNPNALQQMAEMVVEMITRDRSGNRGAGIKGIMQQLADERKAKPKPKPEPKPEPKPKALEAISDPSGRPEKAKARTARSKFAGMPRANQLRRADHEARRGVRKARGELAEMILNGIQENEALKALKAAGKAKKAADAAAAKKPKHTKRDSLELAGTVTSNHPDYVKKKLYNRPTKGSTMPGDNPSNATEREPIASINKRGLTNKSAAKQKRAKTKFAKLDNVPTPPQETKKGSYADEEYKDIMKGGDKDFN